MNGTVESTSHHRRRKLEKPITLLTSDELKLFEEYINGTDLFKSTPHLNHSYVTGSRADAKEKISFEHFRPELEDADTVLKVRRRDRGCASTKFRTRTDLLHCFVTNYLPLSLVTLKDNNKQLMMKNRQTTPNIVNMCYRVNSQHAAILKRDKNRYRLEEAEEIKSIQQINKISSVISHISMS
ncbi:hypothetical protein SNEBB_007664 [Seison nebaliae]|nr:hypothetical protein SNEBB_007664 [Seison nebaliae]